ncbi:MAG: hypothetical protein FWC68_02635, partial [Oscillospiraceae bacterium]|nr:hypothetical protein [Oscillospiraceae bacterium]
MKDSIKREHLQETKRIMQTILAGITVEDEQHIQKDMKMAKNRHLLVDNKKMKVVLYRELQELKEVRVDLYNDTRVIPKAIYNIVIENNDFRISLTIDGYSGTTMVRRNVEAQRRFHFSKKGLLKDISSLEKVYNEFQQKFTDLLFEVNNESKDIPDKKDCIVELLATKEKGYTDEYIKSLLRQYKGEDYQAKEEYDAHVVLNTAMKYLEVPNNDLRAILCLCNFLKNTYEVDSIQRAKRSGQEGKIDRTLIVSERFILVLLQ